MKPFKKILVPVDFSACSAEALRVAADMSQRYDAAISIVHCYEPMTYMVPEGHVFYTAAQMESLFSEFAKALASAKKDAEAAGAKRVDTQQLEGIAASEIVEFARKGGFDLIVMGTHGRTGLKHALLGSVAEKVLRRAPCPVLTVHASQDEAHAG